MEITIKGSATVAKSFSIKREKDAEGNERVIAHLKLVSLFVRRDDFDEIAGMPIGWSAPWYRDNGEPWTHMSVLLVKRKLYATGTIQGQRADVESGESENPAPLPTLGLNKAAFADIRFNLDKLGGILSASIAWPAAGDEVDDVSDLLGNKCSIELKLVDWIDEENGQRDGVPPVAQGTPASLKRQLQKLADMSVSRISHGDDVVDLEQYTNARGKRVPKTHAAASAEAMESSEDRVVIHGDARVQALPPPGELTAGAGAAAKPKKAGKPKADVVKIKRGRPAGLSSKLKSKGGSRALSDKRKG